MSLEFWAGRLVGSGYQELLQARAGFFFLGGAGEVEGRCERGGRKRERKISFMILKGVVSQRNDGREG